MVFSITNGNIALPRQFSTFINWLSSGDFLINYHIRYGYAELLGASGGTTTGNVAESCA